MNEVSYGRVTYFEPNNLFGGNNMAVNQEDLTKYVNLSVRIPSRFYDESAIKKNYDSILKGCGFKEKINNKDYTKFYLTDNYVNVTYTEFGRDNEINNGELFGIESINISFDVQFQPIVSINFIDVKGYGLMSTMEYNYEEGKVNNLTAKSFFTSLFNFPYPIFTLEIKGYYGRNVSLDLALKDFHTSFDSQSGNFITNVTFIGHLYGVYGDIPMLFLMVSPFLDNCKTWNEINDESNIPTYLELLTYYKDILSNGSFGEFDSSFIYFTNKQVKLEELKTVERLYENIFKESELNLSRYRINENNVIELATTDNPSNINNVFKGFILKQETEINLIAPYSELKHGITNRTISSDYNMTIIKNNKYTPGEFSFFSINNYYPIHILKKEIENIEKEIETLEALVRDEMTLMVARNLGFSPNIKNIYKMVFKHLDCFSKIFYSHIKNIENKRKSDLTNYNDIKSDVIDFEQNGLIPPFPLFFDNKKNEIIYPGDIEGFKDRQEVILTEKFYNTIEQFNDEKNTYASLINLIRLENQGETVDMSYNNGSFFMDFAPSEINSYLRRNYFVLTENYNEDAHEKNAENILKIFLARLNTYSRMFPMKENLADFIDSEFNLLISALPSIKNDVGAKMYNLCSDEEYIKNLYNTLSGGTDWGFINYTPGDEDKINGDNGDYTKIIKKNDINSNLIIYRQGTFDVCQAAYSSIKKDDKKIAVPQIAYNNFIKNYIQDFIFNRYEKVEDICLWGYYGADLEGDVYEDKKWTCGKKVTIHYLTNETPFIDINNDENYDFRCFFSESYQYKTEEYRKKPGSYVNVGADDVAKTPSYTERINEKNEKNKICLISLLHLLAAGEALYYGDDDTYFIPTSVYGRTPELSDWTSFTFLKYFKNDTIFGDALKVLYKKISLNETLSEAEQLLYKHFDIPDTLSGNVDYATYYYVIGKNCLYDKEDIDFIEPLKFRISNLFNLTTSNIAEQVKVNDKKEELKKEFKISIYYTLKTLYDKWFSSLESSFFNLDKCDNNNNNISEFNRVHYLDTHFNNISESLIVNMDYFTNTILSVGKDNKSYESALSYMAKLAQDNQSTFLVLPTKFFNENLREMFKPQDFRHHDAFGSTYVVMFNGDVSHVLDIPNSQYAQDGFSLTSYRGDNIEERVDDVFRRAETVENVHDFTIQAFGVTYGMQNQNFFRNISVDTQTPQVTDYSIANLLTISQQGNDATSNGIVTTPQSIYPIYANRSYNCTVEMMGCMNISPLMYFQLNNIPMFKGVYMIFNVEHKITPSDFTTTFTGVRVSKFKIPLNKKALNISSLNYKNIKLTELKNSELTPVSGTGESVVLNGDDVVNLDLLYKSLNSGNTAFVKYSENCVKKKNNPLCNEEGQPECCDCYRSAVLALQNLISINKNIVDDGSYNKRENSIVLLREDNGVLRYVDFDDDKNNRKDYSQNNKYTDVREKIKMSLVGGRPVIVGVNHTFGKTTLNEGTSDHWVLIYAYHIGNRGDTYFRYFETGSDRRDSNDRTDILTLKVGEKPLFYNNNAKPSNGVVSRYDVTVVRFWDATSISYTKCDYKFPSKFSLGEAIPMNS